MLDNVENKHSLYHGEDCMKKFCISLREHAADVISSERDKVLPLTDKQLKLHQDATECYICKKNIHTKTSKDKNHEKVRANCHFTGKCRVAAHSICKLRFNVPNEIPAIFHIRSSYDYHIIWKN